MRIWTICSRCCSRKAGVRSFSGPEATSWPLDGDLDLVLLKVENQREPVAEAKTEHVLVRVGGGVKLPHLMGWAARSGLSGLENLTGIPGSVGGAVAMNAGSYGTDMAAVLHRVRLWTPENGLNWVSATDCCFAYRRFSPDKACAPGGRFLVWEAEFTLQASQSDKVLAAMRYTMARKKATQPVTAKSAGCVFKNPEGESAGKLLDRAGLRGKRIGDMAFSDLHANFLVNLGKGRSADALELLDMGRSLVQERFGIRLETEVLLLS